MADNQLKINYILFLIRTVRYIGTLSDDDGENVFIYDMVFDFVDFLLLDIYLLMSSIFTLKSPLPSSNAHLVNS